MYRNYLLLIVSIICFSCSTAQNSNELKKGEKEILLVGTMHTVPKIVKNSYRPMLKFAKKYQPEAIFVESPMPSDTLSWDYLKKGWSKGYQWFYKLSDSLRQSFPYDALKFNTILKKEHKDMSTEELDFLIRSFGYLRDNANHEYYSYIKKHGVQGAKKPTRHEDGDLTYKLALYLGMKKLNNMDDQRTNGKYHKAWRKCVQEGKSNGNNEIISKLNKKDYNKAIFPAVMGNLGKHTNKRSSLERLHKMSSFTYAKVMTPGCIEGERYWDERNRRIAKNIATQVLEANHQRNIVIVGASHIIGLEKELKKNYPTLKVTLLND